MGLAYDLVVASVVTIVAVVVHLMMVELISPGTILWETATTGTENLNGTQRVSFWFEIMVLWVPLIGIGGVWLWTVVKAYKRQVQTAVRPPT